MNDLHQAHASGERTAQRRTLTLALLTAIGAVQFFDRALMVVILEPLKQQFGLSDSQLGFLSGLSYAAAFALAGIPLGWLADRVNRRRMLTVMVLGWSAMVALGGTASGFVALVLSRIGVGATDAGSQPPSVSMIADLYPAQQRASAVGWYYAGVPLGMGAGFLGGAMLTAALGWQAGFWLASGAGLVMALLLMLLVREPVRGQADAAVAIEVSAEPPPSLRQTLSFMWGQSALVNLYAASVLVTATSSAMMSWIGSLLIRSHGLSLPAVGLLTAVCMGGFGAIGTIVVGRWSDRLADRDLSLQLRLMAGAAAAIGIFGIAVCVVPSVAVLAVCLALFAAAVAGLNGPTYSLTQTLVKVRMRGVSVSSLIVLLNLIGVGVGPTLAGVLSDVFTAQFGSESVRWSMAAVLVLNAPAVWLFWRASQRLSQDLGRLR